MQNSCLYAKQASKQWVVRDSDHQNGKKAAFTCGLHYQAIWHQLLPTADSTCLVSLPWAQYFRSSASQRSLTWVVQLPGQNLLEVTIFDPHVLHQTLHSLVL